MVASNRGLLIQGLFFLCSLYKRNASISNAGHVKFLPSTPSQTFMGMFAN